ncbi:antibiotic biosynthesis monooxygenase [Prauserella shujinwangii]|uniref:Antibiotic biosynthesis monooxygenase n=1 Tax=Prauserella shujinwangii TaxID=1453103 RepID=A0A2T0LU01_9PSEU|nr:antibiotic biosynthesis monooxygenase [Prauserella shujinwangii]PRX47218.1 antibiotic biosynthesis monooxygenase [Prauserella shujinwangii]
MLLEHALLHVKPGRAAEFESAFAEARPLIAGMPGFRRLTLSRCARSGTSSTSIRTSRARHSRF